MKHNKGFTLIELLVVIAIIGILASVVLASLNTARTKGNDVKIKSQIGNIRAAAEAYYIGIGNYGGPATTCTGGTAGSMFTSTDVEGLVDSNNYPSNANLVCNGSNTAWAVSAQLAGTSNFWCADSTGASKAESAALGSGVTVCP